ncbi:MAG: adenosine deaminase, partial [Anaerolineae bacterium]|nr:adenosine deaminase [Anaerolineae bacterium]
EYEDFTLLSAAVASDLAAQNIRYAEVFYSPIEYERYGLKIAELTQAIRKGLNKVPHIRIALIPDLVRDFGPENGMRTLAQLRDLKELGVIGIGIGGSEQRHPPEPWATVYQQARKWGFHTTAHAGEADGAHSICGAINALNIERIGHGTRAEEDPVLVDYLAVKQIPLEMCPISNVRTAVVQQLEDHPIHRYFEQGLLVTVNTDDPKMFGNNLAEEYALLVDRLGFSREDILDVDLNGIRASWLTPDEKEDLIDAFIEDDNWYLA